jgi:pilus assembly protein Flp/PilA
MTLLVRLRQWVRDSQGQDLLEYALLIALIALVCVGAVALAGTAVSTVFTNIAGQIPAGI